MEYTLNKKCERCGESVPDDFQNLLCGECYQKLEGENATKLEADKQNRIDQAVKNPDSAVSQEQVEDRAPLVGSIVPDPKFGIKDSNYRENPEADDKDQILANLAQFIYSHDPAKKRVGKMLWYPQRNMYTFIKNYCMKKILSHPQYPKYLWKPKIVDVGCGSGVGSNILSQEADMVWGIDKNDFSLEFARECFTREKNGFYYSCQVTFDNFDIVNDTRETMKFDVVAAIEVLEHVYDTDKFLRGLIRFTKRDKNKVPIRGYDATEFFISTPNRGFHKLRKDHPSNPFHVREWLAYSELVPLLKNYFDHVEVMNQKGEPIPEGVEDKDEVALFRCSIPKI